MKKIILIILIAIFLLSIYFLVKKMHILTPPTEKLEKVDFSQESPIEDLPRISVVAENLSVPWALAFLPNKKILVTERSGSIKIIDNGDVSTIAQIPVVQTGESGLHGIALDPEYEENDYVYIYYTTRSNNENTTNRVSRYTFQNNALSHETVLVDNIPGASNHDGGRIKFGPDNYLYITTGDAQEPSRAQNTNSLAGKILRVDRNGNAANDNPFGNLVYSYGHRNPQGITWNDSGELFATEHGRSGALSGLDEFNKIELGNNYGWPEIEGNKTQEGMITPILNSGANDTWAPAGLAYKDGTFYFGGLRGSTLYTIKKSGDEYVLSRYFSDQFGRIREVIIGPDNMLYITTSNLDGRGNPRSGDDKIIRVNPQKL